MRRGDGAYRWFLFRAEPLRDERGKIVKWYGTYTDIEDRKRGEAVLREQAGLLDLTHDTIFVRDMNDVITYWNRGAEERYGWPREQALGKTSHQLMQTIFPAPLEEITAELRRAGRWEGELVHTKRDGTQVIVASRWSLQRDERGRPVATLETNNDITERKRMQEALDDAQANLARVNRAILLGEMTASIAHEVNQPIAAVVTGAGAGLRWLAAQPPDLEEARQTLQRIVKDGNRASDVISRIRALVRKAPPQKDLMDINDTILEVVALTRSEVQRNCVSLQTRFSSDLPLVVGDRIQLQQVILNLIIERHRGDERGRRGAARVADRLRASWHRRGVRHGAGFGPGAGLGQGRPAVRGILYDQARWHRHGAGDQPVDHRGPRRAAVGDAERAQGRGLAVHAADRRRTGVNAAANATPLIVDDDVSRAA